MKRWFGGMLAVLLLFLLPACTPREQAELKSLVAETAEAALENSGAKADLLAADGVYTKKDDVALYLYQYGKLPQNFITKREAQRIGWQGGALEPFAPGKCIGGSYFGNYDGLLPEKDGRKYYECDIDTLGAEERGAKRIVYSDDGLIYYTGDHYKSFTLLYGEAPQ